MRTSHDSNWHSSTIAAVQKKLACDSEGLDSTEAEKRLQDFGENRLPEPRAVGVTELFLRQFQSPLLYILLAAVFVSLVVGEYKDAGFILVVLLLNAVIGAYQEFQAEKNSRGLKQLLKFNATIVRDGRVQEIPSNALVPGDIVVLESGNRVPADLRLIEANELRVDESLLTGESVLVDKSTTATLPNDAPLSERPNMAYAGSLVSHGRGKAIVVATGRSTEVGKLAVSLESEDGKPPLIVRMERFTNWIAATTIILSLLIGFLHVFVAGQTVTDAFFFVIALAVSAIPEGLPVAITVCLAVAASRMAKRNVIVRRLAAVEGLGSCTLIATDKTGTLTCNELTVQKVVLTDQTVINVSGSGFIPEGSLHTDKRKVTVADHDQLRDLVRTVSLCNEASLEKSNNQKSSNQWRWRGDTVDIALLSLAYKSEYSNQSYSGVKHSEIPYESENQFAAVFYESAQSKGTCDIFVKGSPERLMAMCQLTKDQTTVIRQQIDELAGEGLRVLAVASGQCPASSLRLSSSDTQQTLPNNLNLLGLVAMADPIRPGVTEAVQQCKQAGVKIVMITGDHKVTALSIAKQLGLASEPNQVCTGQELESQNPIDWNSILTRTRVFARVTPAQKLTIVNAAKERGDFVAVTGDGVNDAPALNAANIGVAMGKAGTDVARDAAELVLADDNFASIVNGIEEGRIAYDNIRKIIFLLVAMGAAELLLVFLAILTGMPLPLLPIQLLWLNLVTDGIQGVALAFEPGTGDSLNHSPRDPNEPIFNRLMIQRMVIAVLVAGLGGFFVFYGAIKSGYSVEHARNLLLLVMVLFENFHVGNCRSETRSLLFLSPFRSPMLLYGSATAFLLHVVAMHLPFMQSILATAPLHPRDWLIAIGVAFLVLPAIELHKWYWNRKHGHGSSSMPIANESIHN